MKILVTNPTGRIGSRILRELIAPEFTVRVIVRDPTRLPLEIRRQVELVRGSADDPSTLRWAVEDIESLFWCVPPESMRETNVVGHYERFAHAGSAAIREAQIRRVVTVSADGEVSARRASPITGLHAMEEILNQSGASIRHLRCGWLFDNLLNQLASIRQRRRFSHSLPGHLPLPMVSVSDVVDTALRWLVRRDWEGIESLTMHSREKLNFCRAATILQEILEQPVAYEEVLPGHYVQRLTSLGGSAEYARGQIERLAQLAEKFMHREPDPHADRTFMTLRRWVETELVPLFYGPAASAGAGLVAASQ
jgi:uncharacterized protein YbjT (DUF2867 family)